MLVYKCGLQATWWVNGGIKSLFVCVSSKLLVEPSTSSVTNHLLLQE